MQDRKRKTEQRPWRQAVKRQMWKDKSKDGKRETKNNITT
jgi:hypothetical protein